jgi:hypothetical protein
LIAGGDQAHNPIIKEPASQQKTGWLRKACRDGRYPLMRALGGVKLLILDDLVPSNRSGPEQRHDMLEIIEDLLWPQCHAGHKQGPGRPLA